MGRLFDAVSCANAIPGIAPSPKAVGPEKAGGSGTQPAEVFSTPLYFATTCSDSPLPWGAGETTEQRVEALRAQVAAVPAEAFAPIEAGLAGQAWIKPQTR